MYGFPGMMGGPPPGWGMGMPQGFGGPPPGYAAPPPQPQRIFSPGGGGGSDYSSPEEAALYNSVAAAIEPVAHLEKEWDRDKFQKKMIEYLNKAAKGTSFGGKQLDGCLANYCTKFFESYWRALGDRYAYVEQIEFSPSIVAAVKYNFPRELWAGVPEDELMQKVTTHTMSSFDQCRWFSWGYQVVKTTVSGKTSQKKVSECVDSSREALVKMMAEGQGPVDSDSFMESWVQRAIGKLGRGPQDILPKPVAIKLFNELVQNGGGMPRTLEKIQGKPPPNWPVVDEAVSKAYGPGGAMGGAGMGMGGGMPSAGLYGAMSMGGVHPAMRANPY